jgi:alkaline phosphatase
MTIALVTFLPAAGATTAIEHPPSPVANAAIPAPHPDFDADGYADLAIGAPYMRTGPLAAGEVHVVYGSAEGPDVTRQEAWRIGSGGLAGRPRRGDHFGWALATGDFDADGFDDLAVGARWQRVRDAWHAGAVHVLNGSAAGLQAGRTQVWTQDCPGIADRPERGDAFGTSLVADDFDGDGYADLAVGAPMEDRSEKDAGIVHVIYGSGQGLSASRSLAFTQASPGMPDRPEANDLFGRSLATGDFDADGRSDLAVGVPYEGRRAFRMGIVHILPGAARGLDSAAGQVWHQDSPGILERAQLRDQFGQALAAGDVDGDGFDDLIAGVWFEDFRNLFSNEGGLHLIRGSETGLTADGDAFWTQDSHGIEELMLRRQQGPAAAMHTDSWVSLLAVLVLPLVLAWPSGSALAGRQLIAAPAQTAHPKPQTLLVAGDIASCAWRDDSRTARLIETRRGTVMTAGDNVYQLGTLDEFQRCYGPSWGRFLARTRPVLGNHDYAKPGAAGYFAYFGSRAGPAGRGYYAFDLGAWRVYALDSDCSYGDRCSEDSAQYRWLATDLARDGSRCSLAVLHHPHYSSGPRGNSNQTRPLLNVLHHYGVEIVINGHDHLYERFAPARPWGKVDRAHGFRQFIVGTGGAPLYPFRMGRPRHSVVRQARTHGVLQLTLAADGYAWEFLPVRRGTFTDTGQADCHDPPA